MIIAAIADIHGNAAALRAVLSGIDEAGIHTILNAGDSVAGHNAPAECIDLLRSHAVHTVQSENDRNTMRYVRKRAAIDSRLDATKTAVIAQASTLCRSEHIEYLRRLPKTLTLRLDGIDVALAHGTLAGQTHSLTQEDTDDRFRRQREIAPARIYIFGRTHKPYARHVDDALFVNPGSVGEEAGAAHYAIISTEVEPWTATFHTVAY